MTNRLSLDHANRICAAALAKGVELDLKPLTIAVVDAGGHLIALQRQDGASTLRPQIAIAKATGAIGLGISSRKIGEMAAERPTFVAALAALAPSGLVPAAGGIILRGEDDHAIGAIGITGDLSDNDEICAIAGALAGGLKVD